MLKKYVKEFSNSELVYFIKDLKKNEKNYSNILNYSKNFRHLLSVVRETENMDFSEFVANLEFDIKEELFNRIYNNNIVIY